MALSFHVSDVGKRRGVSYTQNGTMGRTMTRCRNCSAAMHPRDLEVADSDLLIGGSPREQFFGMARSLSSG